MRARLEFKKEDCWVGVFWRDEVDEQERWVTHWHVWVCLLPMLPLHISWTRESG